MHLPAKLNKKKNCSYVKHHMGKRELKKRPLIWVCLSVSKKISSFLKDKNTRNQKKKKGQERRNERRNNKIKTVTKMQGNRVFR